MKRKVMEPQKRKRQISYSWRPQHPALCSVGGHQQTVQGAVRRNKRRQQPAEPGISGVLEPAPEYTSFSSTKRNNNLGHRFNRITIRVSSLTVIESNQKSITERQQEDRQHVETKQHSSK